ncbi:MAG: DUF4296 domain-containing protein [Bacteroidetes bacterium]|nr:DUF4296 domain-containing protein [Bacteroidota bacterium]
MDTTKNANPSFLRRQESPLKLFICSLFIVHCSLFSCSSSNEKTVVFEIIPKKTMTKMLFDVHFSDAVINTYNNQDKPNIQLSQAHYDALFAKYGFTDTVFHLNIEHYTLTGEIKYIYEKVLDSLNNMKARLTEEEMRKK